MQCVRRLPASGSGNDKNNPGTGLMARPNAGGLKCRENKSGGRSRKRSSPVDASVTPVSWAEPAVQSVMFRLGGLETLLLVTKKRKPLKSGLDPVNIPGGGTLCKYKIAQIPAMEPAYTVSYASETFFTLELRFSQSIVTWLRTSPSMDVPAVIGMLARRPVRMHSRRKHPSASA